MGTVVEQPKPKDKEKKPDPHFLQRAMFRALRGNVEVYITTVSGMTFLGTITDQDQFVIQLKSDNAKHVTWFYKHGIESIQLIQES